MDPSLFNVDFFLVGFLWFLHFFLNLIYSNHIFLWPQIFRQKNDIFSWHKLLLFWYCIIFVFDMVGTMSNNLIINIQNIKVNIFGFPRVSIVTVLSVFSFYLSVSLSVLKDLCCFLCWNSSSPDSFFSLPLELLSALDSMHTLSHLCSLLVLILVILITISGFVIVTYYFITFMSFYVLVKIIIYYICVV